MTQDEFERLPDAQKSQVVMEHHEKLEYYWTCYKCGERHKGLLAQARTGWCDGTAK